METQNSVAQNTSKKVDSVPYPSVKKNRKFLMYIALFAIIVIVAVGAFILFSQYNEVQKIKQSSDAEYLKSKLSNHLILPSGEPLIATINDADKLRSEQSFYKNAQNDDKVFIWQDKAIIYRPSIDKIVDFGIIINPTVSPTPTPTQGN